MLMRSPVVVLLTAVLTLLGWYNVADAQTKPIQLALFSPVQIFPETSSIAGIRLSLLYGNNVNVTGVDVGLVNRITGSGTGIQWGGVGLTDGNFNGVQWNVFANVTKGNVEGVQLGWYNSAGHVHGAQLGLVNRAGTMKGLQLGILNFIDTGGQFPFFPIVNWSF